MSNYSPEVPKDKNGVPLQHVVSKKALASHSQENATVSSVITVSQDTTALEISAVGGAAVMKWIATSDTAASVVSAASGANFDYSIPSGTVRRFVIPRETQGSNNNGSVQGINRAEGLYRRVAYKSVGISSILATEY